VQETLLQTFKRLDAFEPRGEGALQAYLRQAIVNRIRNEIRNAGVRPAGVELESDVPDQGTSPLEAAIGQQTVENYEAALNRLSPQERDAIVTRLELGLSFAEVAEVLGKPSAAAARMAVVRALVRLADEMRRT
jgi:RNA polymerase sigma-70 factor (ECF subfamily)